MRRGHPSSRYPLRGQATPESSDDDSSARSRSSHRSSDSRSASRGDRTPSHRNPAVRPIALEKIGGEIAPSGGALSPESPEKIASAEDVELLERRTELAGLIAQMQNELQSCAERRFIISSYGRAWAAWRNLLASQNYNRWMRKKRTFRNWNRVAIIVGRHREIMSFVASTHRLLAPQGAPTAE